MRGNDGVAHEVQDHAGLLRSQSAVDQVLAGPDHGTCEELVRPRHTHDDSGQARVALQHPPDGLDMRPDRIGPTLPSGRDIGIGGDPLQAGGQQILARGDRAIQPGGCHPHPLGHSGEREVRDAELKSGVDDVVARETGSRSGRSAQSCR